MSYDPYCPICGKHMGQASQVSAPGCIVHRCDPKKLSAIEAAHHRDDNEPMLSMPPKSRRLKHGFQIAGLSGDDD